MKRRSWEIDVCLYTEMESEKRKPVVNRPKGVDRSDLRSVTC